MNAVKTEVRAGRRRAGVAQPRRPDRPVQILGAACRAILARGFAATRIVDIAREAGTSTGTIHYYFEVKDDVLIAALTWASEQLFDRLDEAMAGDEPNAAKLGRMLDFAPPYKGALRDEYVLWIELWTRVLHDPDLLDECEAISGRWRGYFLEVVRCGTASGEFEPVAEPDEVANRLIALIDGLSFEAVVGYHWTSPELVHERLLVFAAEQLRVPRAALERKEER